MPIPNRKSTALTDSLSEQGEALAKGDGPFTAV
jgi:hypothetical protein